jgi:hypothetical protein
MARALRRDAHADQRTFLPGFGEDFASGAIVTVGLWGVTSGLTAATLAEAIPPGCRRVLDAIPPSAVSVQGDEALVAAPDWPAAGATHFVPSFSALTTAPFSIRFELSVQIGGAWTPWAASVGLGPAAFASSAAGGPIAVDVDVFRTAVAVEAVRLRLRVRAPDPAAVLAARWALTLSASGAPTRAPSSASTVPATPVRLAVPPISQMETDAALAHRICSPTCVAMVLGYWRRPAAVAELAREVFHPATDLYGVWPAAILAAGRRGVAGYLLRFPDWAAAAWCLARGFPVIASVRYASGELTGAAAAATPGHLLVLTGFENGVALVNDPAAPTAASVSRRYAIDELRRVWLERSAVGYVLFAVDR